MLSHDPQSKRIDTGYESDIKSQLPEYVSLLEQCGIQPPLYVTLSFAEVKDGFLWVSPILVGVIEYYHQAPITKNTLATECEVIDNFAIVGTPRQAARFMKPMFDVLWRAAHYSRSVNFDKEGNWKDL